MPASTATDSKSFVRIFVFCLVNFNNLPLFFSSRSNRPVKISLFIPSAFFKSLKMLCVAFSLCVALAFTKDIYLVQSVPCLNFPKLYVLYLTVLTPSYWYEQFILNNFLNSIPGAILSK